VTAPRLFTIWDHGLTLDRRGVWACSVEEGSGVPCRADGSGRPVYDVNRPLACVWARDAEEAAESAVAALNGVRKG
jgi:hypothetical protein